MDEINLNIIDILENLSKEEIESFHFQFYDILFLKKSKKILEENNYDKKIIDLYLQENNEGIDEIKVFFSRNYLKIPSENLLKSLKK